MTVNDLLPRAREIAAEQGGTPSINRLKTSLKVGWDRAKDVRAELAREAAERQQTRRRAFRRIGRGQVRNHLRPVRSTYPRPIPAPEPTVAASQVTPAVAGPAASPRPVPRRVATWPILVLAAPAFVAIWAGWVGIGALTGFGEVNLLPGIVANDGWATLNTAITLPIGMETYAAYALRVWLSGAGPARARRFAKWSAFGALALGAGGQIAYHLMAADGMTEAPWQITMLVACIPVAVLGMGAALVHLTRGEDE
jgi:hypothetical protein